MEQPLLLMQEERDQLVGPACRGHKQTLLMGQISQPTLLS